MLTIVPTPIGNLGDMTFRAVEALKAADLVAAEDTRRTGLLLQHYEIRKPLVSFHEHNEASRTAELCERLARGESVALVTDAGMPGLSDPGYRLVRACRERGLPLTVLPGASAILTAVVGSGLPCDRFFFGGFLPVKSGQRTRVLRQAAAREETSVYFESPHRLCKTLQALAEGAPACRVCVARELSKKFEEYRTGSPAELLAHFTQTAPRGEITLVISPPA